MTESLLSAITDDQIFKDVTTVWRDMLALGVTRTAPPHDIIVTPDQIYGCVSLSGQWTGSIQLFCSQKLARTAVAAMMGMQASDLGPDEVSDGFGEITNMVGGQIKNRLPAPSLLTPPVVASGTNLRISIPQTEIERKDAFDIDGEPLVLLIYKAK